MTWSGSPVDLRALAVAEFGLDSEVARALRSTRLRGEVAWLGQILARYVGYLEPCDGTSSPLWFEMGSLYVSMLANPKGVVRAFDFLFPGESRPLVWATFSQSEAFALVAVLVAWHSRERSRAEVQ